MGWFDGFIRKTAHQAAAKAVKAAFEPGGSASNVIREILGVDLPGNAPMNQGQFFFAMCQAFAQAGVKDADESRRYARDTLAEFLKDEKIVFGDPAYAWTRHGAFEIAHAWEIEHWEPQA